MTGRGVTRVRRLTAALAVTALLLGGCSLPDRTDPKYVGPAATPNPAQDRAQDPPNPQGVNNLSDLVVRYLLTSVGGNVTSPDQPDAVSETQARMKTFMTETARAQWSPGPQAPLIVVQAKFEKLEREPGTNRSSLAVEFTPIGQLDRDGRLVLAQLDDTFERNFVFEGEESDGEVRLSKVPHSMLLSVSGLNEWYQPQPIYFWEADVEAPKLVPDLRYMPRVLPASKRVSEVMLWLVDGPSSWLAPVVDKLPSDIETKDNPTLQPDGSVVVNLSSKARAKTPEDLRKLSSQIRWSMDGHPPVTLSYENAKDTTNASDGYASDNAAVVPGEPDQEKFVVVDGVVRPSDLQPGGPPELFLPGPPFNTNVVSATINRGHTRAALVRRVANGRQQLVVSVADPSAEPRYVDSTVPPSATLSRPVWINRPAPRFLVADGSRLWSVTPPAKAGEAAKADIVPGPNDATVTAVSAFSVAPDGRRIALIVNGKAMIAPVRIENGRLRLGEQRQVPNTLGDNQAIGWISETTLAIGGKPNPDEALLPDASYSLISTSIDGTGEAALPLRKPSDTSTYVISRLSARTNDPTDSLQQVLVLFEANQEARAVFADDTGEIKLSNAGPVVSPSAGQPPTGKPTSPFYAD